MSQVVNNFVLNIATVNGSGSQSANTILLKSLFKMGIPVGGKNVFPSNIAGLPTWFWVRASQDGYAGRRKNADIVVAMNQQTILEDCNTLKVGGIFLYNSELKFDPTIIREDIFPIPVPFKSLVDQATTQVKIKKMLVNIIYVGVLAEILKIEDQALSEAMNAQFSGKQSVLEVNQKALLLGKEWAKNNVDHSKIPFKAQRMNATSGKIMIDGNSAAAIGLAAGGATFGAWYPITPSSSLVENFIKYADELRKDKDGKNTFAVIQAEDELASICMVLGAGWAGARAFTATSGPGISLMQEAAGYAYYAEIPSVIWDVQRVGPSTGMPTRTAQGDLTFAVNPSHGDTKHPVLLPGSAKECFEFGQTCFDLAERLQSMVFVLSDLDLGMNLWMEDEFKYPTKAMDRGKVLTEEKLKSMTTYERYGDPDGDAIPWRPLPGMKSPLAGYLTRGSGHNLKAAYTEKSDEYKFVVDRLNRKWQTAKKFVPPPIIDDEGTKIGIIAYGSTDSSMQEARDILSDEGFETSYMRIRALPFTDEVIQFIDNHERIYVIDQNRDGQMHELLKSEYTSSYKKFRSIRHYDGTPITAEAIFEPILKLEKGN